MQNIEQIIEEIRVKIIEKESELTEMKKSVNQLCKFARLSPLYDIEGESEKTSKGLLRGDEYYMQPIASVIGWILERRKVSGLGPATVNEIYEAMKAGGYKFDAKDDENAMRGISISMCKNVAKFHRLPSGKFGLTAWYPELKGQVEEKKLKKKRRKKRKKSKQTQPKIAIVEIPKKRGRPRKESLVTENIKKQVESTENEKE